MSTTLHWRPVPNDDPLGYELKRAIAPRLWDHDGSLGGEWVRIGREFIPFLEGVSAGAPKGAVGDENSLGAQARQLIKLIEKHGEIEVALLV